MTDRKHQPKPAGGLSAVDRSVGQRWRVRVTDYHGQCWIADWDGDPGRTLICYCAKTWVRRGNAERAARLAKEKYGRNYVVEPVPNAELSGPRPLAAEGSRSNAGLERTETGHDD